MSTVYETSRPRRRPPIRGKVRDTYPVCPLIGGKKRHAFLIISTDRVSAFGSVLPSAIPDKGRVLNLLSLFWFGVTGSICPSHIVGSDKDLYECLGSFLPDGEINDFFQRSSLVMRLRMLPVECVVRGFLTGSALEVYRQTGSVCGVKLPPGLAEADELPQPIFTPTTKAQTGHDQPLTFDQLVELVGADIAEILKYYSRRLYAKARDIARPKGIIIADTKFEFGIKARRIRVADELLTPDSSRFWDAAEYKPGRPQASFDKQPLRDWLTAYGWRGDSPPPKLPPEVIMATSQRYKEAYRRLVGSPLSM